MNEPIETTEAKPKRSILEVIQGIDNVSIQINRWIGETAAMVEGVLVISPAMMERINNPGPDGVALREVLASIPCAVISYERSGPLMWREQVEKLKDVLR